MADVQQRTLETLNHTEEQLSKHVRVSSKRLDVVSRQSEACIGQLVSLQQDLQYITETLRRLQRLCDLHTDQKPVSPENT